MKKNNTFFEVRPTKVELIILLHCQQKELHYMTLYKIYSTHTINFLIYSSNLFFSSISFDIFGYIIPLLDL